MKKSYGAEQIIGILRQCDVLLAQGKTVREICIECHCQLKIPQ